MNGIELGRMIEGHRHSPVVYFLALYYQQRPAVKIGTTVRLARRIGNIAYGATMRDVLLIVPGGRETEKVYHDRFRAWQAHLPELFWRDGELADFLAGAEQEPAVRQPAPLAVPAALGEWAGTDPMPLRQIVTLVLLPGAGAGAQRRRVATLKQDRARGLRGELPAGLRFPRDVGQDGQTLLYLPADVVGFDQARRGAGQAAP